MLQVDAHSSVLVGVGGEADDGGEGGGRQGAQGKGDEWAKKFVMMQTIISSIHLYLQIYTTFVWQKLK